MPRSAESQDADRLPRLVAVGAVAFFLAYVCLAAPRGLDRAAPIWLLNAFMLALLHGASRKHWPRLIAVGWSANVLANVAAGDAPLMAVGLAACNAVEYGAAAWAISHWIGPHADLYQRRHLVRYVGIIAAAALVSAGLAFVVLAVAGAAPNSSVVFTWAMADFAGLLIVAPALGVLMGAREPLRRLAARPMWPFVVLIAVALLAFLQTRYSLAYLILAALLLVTWRLGLLGAAVAILLTLLIAATATMAGQGPFSISGGPIGEQVLLLQLFLAVCFFLSLPVAYHRRRTRKLAEALADSLSQTREAEARYRLIAERAHDVIVRADCDGRILYISESCRQYGYEPEDLVGRHANELLHPEDLAHHEENMQLLFAGQIPPPKSRQHRFRSRDGRYSWLEGNPSLILDSAGRPLEFLNVLRNIDDHKALESELTAARAEAEAAAEAKSEFLANMSHELRTPLTSVIGFTRLALEQPDLGAVAGAYVQRVGHASEALLSTVNDILDFSKLEAGQVSFQPRPTPVRPLLQAALGLFEPQAAAKDLELRLEAEFDDQLTLLVDPDRLRQLLLNLVGNAVKFTAAGTVTLASAYDPANAALTLQVRDTGPGISQEAQARLFRRFSQVDGSLSRAHGGTGLGLAICKSIVEALGGQIRVRSRLGQGAVFELEAPLREVAPVPAEAMIDAVALSCGLRVLLVDDHAVNRELAGLLLTSAGAEVTEAQDGAEAVELARLWPYDVILMDLRMPRVDGQAAMEEIRRGPGPNDATPILAYTADGTPEVEAQLRRRGFQGMVGKPVSAEMLFAAIAHAVDFAESARGLRDAS